MLNGYKTYICVACGIGSATLYGLEYIDVNQFTLALTIFGFGREKRIVKQDIKRLQNIFAHISKLDPDDSSSLENYKKELAYYVRVRKVIITPDKLEDIEYKEVEIDGKKILISVQ